MNLIWEKSQPVVDGDYLLGDYSFDGFETLVTAVCSFNAPSDVALTVTLEVNGVLTAKAFVIAPGDTAVKTLALNLGVAAGQTVRWLAGYAGAPGNAATNVSVTIEAN